MAENRWLVLIGLVVIVGMLVTAAFALGLFVGKRGWLGQSIEQGINMQPQVQQQEPRPQIGQSQVQQDLQQNRQQQEQPNLIGRMQMLSEEMLVVQTANGTRQIIIGEDTLLLNHLRQEIEWDVLKRGDDLAVFGELSEETRQLEAEYIILLPKKNEGN